MSEYDVKIDVSRPLPQSLFAQVHEGVSPQTVADLLIPTALAGKSIGMDFDEFMAAAKSVWDYLPSVEQETPND